MNRLEDVMKELKGFIVLGLALTLSFIPFSACWAESAKAQLQDDVTQLQNSPDDQELREKIIKLARKVKPALPEEADRYMERGTAALEMAKESHDYADAISEFQKATLAAPWLGTAYYNLGIVQEKAKDYEGAKRNLQLYLLASPNAKDAKKVKGLIYKLEYKSEKAGKEASSAQHSVVGEWDAPSVARPLKITKDDSGYHVEDNKPFAQEAPFFDVVATDTTVSYKQSGWANGNGPAEDYWLYSFTLSEDGSQLVGGFTGSGKWANTKWNGSLTRK
jgi:tetratricopeptide (TPR) repeat protein